LVISEHHRYIFIAVPRTGSNSISKFLLANDPTAESNVLRLGGHTVPVFHHISAADLSAMLGEHYRDYFTFAFVRDPRARFLSLYSYYHHGDAARLVKSMRSPWKDHGGRRVLLARALPFRLWSLLYPYRACSAFLADDRGRLLVDRIGRVESLETDLGEIVREIGIEPTHSLPRLNTTERLDSYPGGRLLDLWFAFKFRRDRRFYLPV
jgi:hypothetical protein